MGAERVDDKSSSRKLVRRRDAGRAGLVIFKSITNKIAALLVRFEGARAGDKGCLEHLVAITLQITVNARNDLWLYAILGGVWNQLYQTSSLVSNI